MKLGVKKSKIKGKGCFAIEDIKKGEIIAVFTGEIISLKEIIKRTNEGIENIDDIFQIGKELYLDLDEPFRSFNHSCNPNAGRRKKNELFAIKNIKKGEEITYDYSTGVRKEFNKEDWNIKCSCGSKNCRKIISNVLTIPKGRLKEYYKLGALPDCTKKQVKEYI